MSEPWTLDRAILRIKSEDREGNQAEVDIPVGVEALRNPDHDAAHIVDLQVIPVWSRLVEEPTMAQDPHTNEVRKIAAGTRITYTDTPAIADCEKPEELVKDEQ